MSNNYYLDHMKKREFWDSYKTNVRFLQMFGILALVLIITSIILYIDGIVFWIFTLLGGSFFGLFYLGLLSGFSKMKKYKNLLRKDYKLNLEQVKMEVEDILNKRKLTYNVKTIKIPPEFSRGESLDTIYIIDDQDKIRINTYYDINTIYIKKKDIEMKFFIDMIDELDSQLEKLQSTNTPNKI